MRDFNPIVIGAVLRVENVEECNSDWERHIHLRSFRGTQFEMDVDESLDVETRFRVGDYWTTVAIPGAEVAFGLHEIDPESNADLRRKDAAIRAVRARHEEGWKQEEAEEVMQEFRGMPREATRGDGAYEREPEPTKPVYAPGVICTFTQGPFHPLKLMERPNSQPGYWVVRCLDHGHMGLVEEEHIRHATPEETAYLARKGGEA